MKRRVKVVHIVYAMWCPHCHPLAVEAMEKVANELDVPLVHHDIDTEDIKKADELVKKYGDWSEDYLIPQIFLEFENNEFKHILTGYPEGVEFTRRAINNLMKSEFYLSLKAQQIAAR